MSEAANPENLFEFPCHYTFKAVGISDLKFSTEISAAVNSHVPVHQDAIHVRLSGKGNYQTVSILVQLENYQQLTDIYARMKTVPGLKMLL